MNSLFLWEAGPGVFVVHISFVGASFSNLQQQLLHLARKMQLDWSAKNKEQITGRNHTKLKKAKPHKAAFFLH